MDATRCAGPTCDRLLIGGPLLDFCSHACAHSWAQADHPTEVPTDGGAGLVPGLYFGASPCRNDGRHPPGWAFPWLDVRCPPEVTA